MDYDLPTPISIELHASVEQEHANYETLHLYIYYQSDNKETHTTNGRIAQLIRRNASGASSDYLGSLVQNVECHGQTKSARRTLTIGDLLIKEPYMFKDVAWKLERAFLVHGVSEWMLLLWNTPWFERLCCHKLAIEVEACTSKCARHILHVQQTHNCWRYDRNSRLQDLGLVLAQLVLAVPLRLVNGDDLDKFEQCVNGEWITVHLSTLNERMYAETLDIQVTKAIYFCLKPEPDFPSDDFKLGYLFMCIERIYNPIMKWCTAESEQWTTWMERVPQKSWAEKAMGLQPNSQDATLLANGRLSPASGSLTVLTNKSSRDAQEGEQSACQANTDQRTSASVPLRRKQHLRTRKTADNEPST
ncbi:hypothetical protein GQ44DRAFT_824107 [Phaeosphaeriaceae sp. PMI808]|nr:hypothetical protein GQ44DRAFT_824107 [Phaeosphaeriaceae sp. PMI808]